MPKQVDETRVRQTYEKNLKMYCYLLMGREANSERELGLLALGALEGGPAAGAEAADGL